MTNEIRTKCDNYITAKLDAMSDFLDKAEPENEGEAITVLGAVLASMALELKTLALAMPDDKFKEAMEVTLLPTIANLTGSIQ